MEISALVVFGIAAGVGALLFVARAVGRALQRARERGISHMFAGPVPPGAREAFACDGPLCASLNARLVAGAMAKLPVETVARLAMDAQAIAAGRGLFRVQHVAVPVGDRLVPVTVLVVERDLALNSLVPPLEAFAKRKG